MAGNEHTGDREGDWLKAGGVEREERGKKMRAVDDHPLRSAAAAAAATRRRAAAAARAFGGGLVTLSRLTGETTRGCLSTIFPLSKSLTSDPRSPFS